MATKVHVNTKWVQMETVGKRLREERLRIGLSQDEFAAIGQLGRKTLAFYESDERAPDTSFLLSLRSIGVDIVYVLTGQRLETGRQSDEPSETDAEEAELVAIYRQLNETGKAILQSFIGSVLNQAVMLKPGTPQRAKRLPENRRAALDERMAENVDRAMAEIERLRAERAAKDGKR